MRCNLTHILSVILVWEPGGPLMLLQNYSLLKYSVTLSLKENGVQDNYVQRLFNSDQNGDRQVNGNSLVYFVSHLCEYKFNDLNFVNK